MIVEHPIQLFTLGNIVSAAGLRSLVLISYRQDFITITIIHSIPLRKGANRRASSDKSWGGGERRGGPSTFFGGGGRGGEILVRFGGKGCVAIGGPDIHLWRAG
jgi:hypothetical protein